MQLTSFTDYALRVLVYLSMDPDRIVSTGEISRAYGVSQYHLGKVVHRLGRSGWVEVRRGRGGGVRLSKTPDEIRIGDVVRDLEPSMRIVECFDAETNRCPIAPVCGLAPTLETALEAFLSSLNESTLADVVRGRIDQLRATYQATMATVANGAKAASVEGPVAPEDTPPTPKTTGTFG